SRSTRTLMIRRQRSRRSTTGCSQPSRASGSGSRWHWRVEMAVPVLDNRSYQDLLDDALARIPVHNPEWTNFNRSDPGVTLLELFAFLTESVIYRANQIPERNRL